VFAIRVIPYFVLTLIFSLSGQTLLKRGVTSVLGNERPNVVQFFSKHLFALASSPYVIGGTITSGIGFLMFMFILSRFDLGRALPILGGVGYILMFIVGKVFLRETTNWINFVGILAIILGLYLLSLQPE
jgi:multidrug transporter EmrE-like cation transporter